MQITPDQLIINLRNSIKDSEYLFNNGKCFQLYLLLRSMWKHAECYYDGNHITTEIDGVWYDINGKYYKQPDNSYILAEEHRHFTNAHRWNSKTIPEDCLT